MKQHGQASKLACSFLHCNNSLSNISQKLNKDKLIKAKITMVMPMIYITMIIITKAIVMITNKMMN